MRPPVSLMASAFALALASAVSLGLARFAYALLLPAMRADLSWNYFTAGLMNTVNAAGYLLGALLLPRLLRRFDARQVLLCGGGAAALLLALHGTVRADAVLLMLRGATGVASAASFVAGGLLAARLAATVPAQAGLVLGVYYGGAGLGIVAASWLLPPLLGWAPAAWAWGWVALGGLSLLATVWTGLQTHHLVAPPVVGAPRVPLALRGYAWALAGYLMFGLGYIGYMTFIITLLREQGLGGPLIVAFYTVLGLAVVASSWLWAALLQRQRGGVPMALLNGLLACATALPVFSTHPLAVLLSGALFGSVFLSVVASTTALVRHNAPPAAWPAGITAFTVVFAVGQIVGPGLVGLIADGPGPGSGGGLAAGLACSAGALALGAVLAWRQKPLAPSP